MLAHPAPFGNTYQQDDTEAEGRLKRLRRGAPTPRRLNLEHDVNADVLRWLQTQLGGGFPADDLTRRYERLGTARAVVAEVLQEHITRLVADPLKVTVNGVASVDNSANLAAFERHLTGLDSITAPDDPPATAPDMVSVITMQVRKRR
ncbi:hypothetical protein [Streptomyces sp. cg2]|uniref:hypothetical protein n=1 Tax=Streptomyces sp. cg2 TaxID=3238799 RepID=UPI0034E2DEC0